jgi:hypothetical protein
VVIWLVKCRVSAGAVAATSALLSEAVILTWKSCLK